jgi:hypothetical protein
MLDVRANNINVRFGQRVGGIGTTVASFGERLIAVPIDLLWQ